MHKTHHLASYLVGRIVSFCRISNGITRIVIPVIVDVITECVLLGWSIYWIGNVLRCFPRRHSSLPFMACRKVGNLLLKTFAFVNRTLVLFYFERCLRDLQSSHGLV